MPVSRCGAGSSATPRLARELCAGPVRGTRIAGVLYQTATVVLRVVLVLAGAMLALVITVLTAAFGPRRGGHGRW